MIDNARSNETVTEQVPVLHRMLNAPQHIDQPGPLTRDPDDRLFRLRSRAVWPSPPTDQWPYSKRGIQPGGLIRRLIRRLSHTGRARRLGRSSSYASGQHGRSNCAVEVNTYWLPAGSVEISRVCLSPARRRGRRDRAQSENKLQPLRTGNSSRESAEYVFWR